MLGDPALNWGDSVGVLGVLPGQDLVALGVGMHESLRGPSSCMTFAARAHCHQHLPTFPYDPRTYIVTMSRASLLSLLLHSSLPNSPHPQTPRPLATILLLSERSLQRSMAEVPMWPPLASQLPLHLSPSQRSVTAVISPVPPCFTVECPGAWARGRGFKNGG